ncbi:MAG TPA: mucoidy inhibitor MuiA family protein [Flavobacteriales bacterium]|nr:mucoidy inhibitor MuiA family protein [Flavobacteriales bacterium]
MRKPWLLLLLLAYNAHAKDLELKTKLTNVTVFQSGAQVTRNGSLNLPVGEHDVVIRDATSLLKKESIQVKGEGNFTILSVNHQVDLRDQDMDKLKANELEVKQKNLMRQMEDLSVKIEVLRNEESVINNMQQVTPRTEGITVEQVSKAQELVRLKLTSIKNDKLALSRQMEELFDQHQKVMQQLTAIRTPKQHVSYEIIVRVLVKNETRGDFSLTYIVPNARWYPSYDLRVKSIDQPMVIDYKANVTQQTGEDWTDVKLKLSTGDPSESSQKPVVSTWLLYLNQHYVQPRKQNNFYRYTDAKFTKVNGTVMDRQTGEPLAFCPVMVYGTNIGATTDGDGNFNLILPENANTLNLRYLGYNEKNVSIKGSPMKIYLQPNNVKQGEVAVISDEEQVEDVSVLTNGVPANYGDVNGGVLDVTKSEGQKLYFSNGRETSTTTGWDYAEKNIEAGNVSVAPSMNIVSTEFTIDEKYTILSDPKNIIVSVQSIQANAGYQYYCAPRLEKDVFLTAQMTDWEQYNLLEGQANVFFEGTFIGSTVLDTRFLTDTLEISLGRDKSVKVERKKSKEYNKRQALGSNNIAYRYWEIAVRNGKQQPVNILIEDQFPLSADSKIEVKRESKGEGKLDDRTGIVTWTYEKLTPNETKNTELKYNVKYPKGTFVGLD